MKTLLGPGYLLVAGLTCSVAAERAILRVEAPRPDEADALLVANEIMAEFSGTPALRLPLHLEARAYAITYLAMERAVLTMPAPAPGAGNARHHAAALAAARDVWRRLFPAAGARLGQIAAAPFRAGPDAGDAARALEAGRAAAAHLLAERGSDRWSVAGDTALAAMQIASAPGALAGTPGSSWLEAIPFVLGSAAQFSARPPYWITMDGTPSPDVAITRAAVFANVDRSTPDGVLARFWSGSPIVAWNRIAHVILAQSGADLMTRAQILAVLNVAMADANLVALHDQTVHGRVQPQWRERWRPTDDPAATTDVSFDLEGIGHPTGFRRDPAPVLGASRPNYPAIPAVIASAAARALDLISNASRCAFELDLGHPAGTDAPRHFVSVDQAARECAFAASLESLHSREACAAGYLLGDAIGRYVLKQVGRRKTIG